MRLDAASDGEVPLDPSQGYEREMTSAEMKGRREGRPGRVDLKWPPRIMTISSGVSY